MEFHQGSPEHARHTQIRGLHSQTKELPIIEIQLERGENGLGFNIKGGTDNPNLEEDSGIFVSQLKETGAAFMDGRLKMGDKIIAVNGIDIQMMAHQEAVNVFMNAGNIVILRVQSGAYTTAVQNIFKKRAAKNRNRGLWYIALGVGVILLLGTVGGFVMTKQSSKV